MQEKETERHKKINVKASPGTMHVFSFNPPVDSKNTKKGSSVSISQSKIKKRRCSGCSRNKRIG